MFTEFLLAPGEAVNLRNFVANFLGVRFPVRCVLIPQGGGAPRGAAPATGGGAVLGRKAHAKT